jgi:hypothetical protein
MNTGASGATSRDQGRLERDGRLMRQNQAGLAMSGDRSGRLRLGESVIDN